VEIGIDLVSDPIIFQKNSEERPCQQEYPAAASPNGGKGGVLHGEVNEISGAVTNVCQQCQDEEEE